MAEPYVRGTMTKRRAYRFITTQIAGHVLVAIVKLAQVIKLI
jgi:hypothetical protein